MCFVPATHLSQGPHHPAHPTGAAPFPGAGLRWGSRQCCFLAGSPLGLVAQTSTHLPWFEVQLCDDSLCAHHETPNPRVNILFSFCSVVLPVPGT